MARTYTQAEVDALLHGGSALDVIAARPYHTIVSKDGMVLCVPPNAGGGGGPNTIADLHPDDYFEVETDDKGNVKLNEKGQATAGGKF